jgi:hypothetical protein
MTDGYFATLVIAINKEAETEGIPLVFYGELEDFAVVACR